MQEYSFQILERKGSLHANADALHFTLHQKVQLLLLFKTSLFV